MEQKEVIFTRRASGLVRELSWVDVFIFVIAGPAASGITYFSVARAADYPAWGPRGTGDRETPQAGTGF